MDKRVVVKSQVLVGGRGKAGGIRLANEPDEAEEIADQILGMDIKGLTVKKVLVDEAADIDTEIYLGIVIDRARRRPVMMASAEGGVEIEEVARATPERIFKVKIEPFLGLQSYQGRDLAFGIGLRKELVRDFVKIAQGLYRAFVESDASLAEINPLVVTDDGKLLAVDGKMLLDDNALFRHFDLAEMRDADSESPEEQEARRHGLSYVKLDGSIGCMVNGAGLAMATMDLIKQAGAEPANFLDVGGGANAEQIRNAFRILLGDDDVRAVLINIFGGILRCDVLAKGVIAAVKELDVKVPVVMRMRGNKEEEGKAMLRSSGLDFQTADTMAEAAERVVAAAGGAR
jgi:succinyl-CoA synthetase beta subunit